MIHIPAAHAIKISAQVKGRLLPQTLEYLPLWHVAGCVILVVVVVVVVIQFIVRPKLVSKLMQTLLLCCSLQSVPMAPEVLLAPARPKFPNPSARTIVRRSP